MTTKLPGIFKWLPVKIYEIDADTQKPLDPNVGRKVQVTYYDIKKNKNGSKSVVAHKSPSPSVHGDRAKDKKDDGGKDASKDSKKDEERANGGGENKKREMPEWSAEEDAKLKELKAANKSWKDIAAEMNRPQWQCRHRHKEINEPGSGGDAKNQKKGGGGGNDKKETDNDKSGGKGGDDKKQDQQPKKSKNEKKQEKQEQDAGKAGSQRKEEETRFTLAEWRTLSEDDMFSLGELQLLTQLVPIYKDRDNMWLRVASRFFDKTGRRVHPEDIREKLEELNEFLGA